MAVTIFINYRRHDSTGTAGRLQDRLAQSFGRKNLFMDIDHIPPGVDFVNYLNNQVSACDVFLAIIGPNWLEVRDEKGDRRLHAPDDFVAIEIAAALAREIRVIPVLVDGTRMPKASDLPESLKPLVRRQAIELRHSHFGRDAEALIEKIREAPNGKSARHNRWRVASAIAAATFLFVGSIGLYGTGWPISPPWAVQPDMREHAEKEKVAASKAEDERRAKEAEQQRLAALKAEEERRAKEAEQQHLAALKAEEERKAKEAEQRRLAVLKALNAEEERKAKEAEQQRLAALKSLPATQNVMPLGCQPARAPRDRLRFDVLLGTSDGLKAIQVKVYGQEVSIEDVSWSHLGDSRLASYQQRVFVKASNTSGPIRLERSEQLDAVFVTYVRPETSWLLNPSLCIEGLR